MLSTATNYILNTQHLSNLSKSPPLCVMYNNTYKQTMLCNSFYKFYNRYMVTQKHEKCQKSAFNFIQLCSCTTILIVHNLKIYRQKLMSSRDT
jgi:hypothetical protein